MLFTPLFAFAIFLAVGAVRASFCPNPTSRSVFLNEGMKLNAMAFASYDASCAQGDDGGQGADGLLVFAEKYRSKIIY